LLISATEARLCEFVASGDLEFKRVAVNPDQMSSLNLPTRPTKTSDSRSNNLGFDYSYEVDAIRPYLLRQMVRHCITQHIDDE